MNGTMARPLVAAAFAGLICGCTQEPFTSPEPADDLGSMPSGGTGGAPPVAGGTGGSGGSSGSGGQAAGTSGRGGATASAGSGSAGDTSGEAGSAGEGSGETIIDFDLELIDDVESEFPHILESGGRNGFWFITDDASEGTLGAFEAYALQPPQGESYYAARIGGTGFTTWGAAIGVTLKAPLASYDASAYCGVSFQASGHGDGWAFMIADRLSEPEGGVCSVDATDPEKQCFDHFGKRFQPSEAWQEHHFTFDELELVKGYTGQNRPFEADAVFSLQFVFDNASGADFELLLDDLAFMICK